MKLRTLAAAGAAALALAGCTGCGGGGGSGAMPSAGPSENGAPDWAVSAAQCMRDNGYPDWPDPVRDDDGRWGWPDSAPDVNPPSACLALFRAGKNRQGNRTVSPADIAQLRKYADCMRAHNVPEWPDPDSDGTFDPPDSVKPLDNANTRLMNANDACLSLAPPGGIEIKG